jgi:archaellum component FlaG (FlaF/FlaG flagellin family)
MKSFKEWREENINEFFGMFRPKTQPPGEVENILAKLKSKQPLTQDQKDILAAMNSSRDKQNAKVEPKAFCPFCKSNSAVLTTDDAYYPTLIELWHCVNCNREWHKNDAETPGPDDKGYGLTHLPKDKVRSMAAPLTRQIECLYLSGLVTEEQMQQAADINQIASQMQFQPTSKKKLIYNYTQDINNMPAMSYTVAQQKMPVVTMTSDGKETQNVAEQNDVIISGPSREQYVIKSAKFPKLYVGQIGGPVHPEQSPRNVAIYNGNAVVNFVAPWGENMVLKPGDYLVKEDEGKYYRIAKQEYEMTYNTPGKIG